MSQSNLKCPDKGGPLTVVSRVKTPFIGIITYNASYQFIFGHLQGAQFTPFQTGGPKKKFSASLRAIRVIYVYIAFAQLWHLKTRGKNSPTSSPLVAGMLPGVRSFSF